MAFVHHLTGRDLSQLRLWLSSVAYTLMAEQRRLGLEGSTLARAECDTIRLKLLSR